MMMQIERLMIDNQNRLKGAASLKVRTNPAEARAYIIDRLKLKDVIGNEVVSGGIRIFKQAAKGFQQFEEIKLLESGR